MAEKGIVTKGLRCDCFLMLRRYEDKIGFIEHRQDNRRSYYHVYSMDCTPAIENHTMFLVLSPEELLIRDEDEAAAELLLANLAVAMTLLSPTQARRLHARYVLKKKFREIAADEGISGSCAAASVTGAITKLQKS